MEKKTPEEEKIASQQKAVEDIQKILTDNGLALTIEQNIKIIPKQ